MWSDLIEAWVFATLAMQQVVEGEKEEEVVTETEAEEVHHAESEERKTFTITGETGAVH